MSVTLDMVAPSTITATDLPRYFDAVDRVRFEDWLAEVDGVPLDQSLIWSVTRTRTGIRVEEYRRDPDGVLRSKTLHARHLVCVPPPVWPTFTLPASPTPT